jgi:hypothetical protein
MTVFTEGKHPAEGILSEANGQRSRDNITVVSGSGVIAPMTVLGRVTATGKFKPSAVGASDGSEVASAICIYGGDATSADLKVAEQRRDAEVRASALTYHSNVDTAPERTAVAAQLAAVGIIVR